MISDRKEAILFIANKQHGGQIELIGEIGEKFFNQFCRMGLANNQTWQGAGKILS